MVNSKEKYALLDKLGICHRCEKATTMPNKKYCPDCLEKIAQYNADHYDSQKAHEYQSRRREIYQQKKEQGICVRCTKEATHGLYCYEHSIKAKKAKKKTAERRKQERHERGLIPNYRINNRLCLRCGMPIDQENTTKYCNACCAKMAEYSAMANKEEQRRSIALQFERNKMWRENKKGEGKKK